MRRPDAQIENSGLIRTYAINDAMNQLILSRLEPRARRAESPSHKRNVRTIAAIFAHLHNNHLIWLKNSAPHLKCPARLDPDRCTIKQAAAAHKKSAAQCPSHVEGRFFRRLETARHEILARELGADLARRCEHVRVHVLARSASSRANPDACAPAWLSSAGRSRRSRHLAMGHTVEASRPYNASALASAALADEARDLVGDLVCDFYSKIRGKNGEWNRVSSVRLCTARTLVPISNTTHKAVNFTIE